MNIRNLRRGFVDFLGQRRQLRRFARSPRLALDYARFDAAIRRRDWERLHGMLRPLADTVAKAGDFRFLRDIANAAFRLDETQLAVDLLRIARRGLGIGEPTDWRGEDISDATLIIRLVDGKDRKPAAGTALIGHICAAAARAARTVVIAEPRMVPLYRRTLPGITVVAEGDDVAAQVSGRVFTATVIDLQCVLGYDAATIARLRRPLVADARETGALRYQYRGGHTRPLVGISWYPPQSEKDASPIGPWTRLVRSLPVQFVSMQRGANASEIAALTAGDPGKVIIDPTVDQMTNMDRFASQVAALDLVITMSNTGAHIAGALKRPMILVRDDLFRLSWPYLSRRVPWYPETIVIGKEGRPWQTMFDEVGITASSMLALTSKSAGS